MLKLARLKGIVKSRAAELSEVASMRCRSTSCWRPILGLPARQVDLGMACLARLLWDGELQFRHLGVCLLQKAFAFLRDCIKVLNSDVGASMFAFYAKHMQLRVRLHLRKLSVSVRSFTALTAPEPLFFVVGACLHP